MQLIFFSFWFFLPAGIANIAPVLATNTPFLSKLSYPLDFNLKHKGTRVLGENKTIRGLMAGVIFGIIIALCQNFLYLKTGNKLISTYYMHDNPVLFGFLLSFGAIAGDSIKSFFKRKKKIQSGISFFPWDQIDYILGGVLTSFLIIKLSFLTYLIIFFLYFFLHLSISYIGFLIHLKKSPI